MPHRATNTKPHSRVRFSEYSAARSQTSAGRSSRRASIPARPRVSPRRASIALTALRRARSDDPRVRFEDEKDRRAFGRAAAIGIEFAAVVVVCLVGGYWLDEKFDTEPTLTLLGLLLGSVTGFRILWKLAKEQARD